MMASRQKLIFVIVINCILLFVLCANSVKASDLSSKITPILQEEINKAPEGTKIPVIISLKDEVDQLELRNQAKGKIGTCTIILYKERRETMVIFDDNQDTSLFSIIYGKNYESRCLK